MIEDLKDCHNPLKEEVFVYFDKEGNWFCVRCEEEIKTVLVID